MRVYELVRPGEPPYAFEVATGWSALRFTLGRILESVPGVTEVRRGGNWFSSDENRAYFLFHGVPFVVWEPFGDNSRYWIGQPTRACRHRTSVPSCRPFETSRQTRAEM